jgi:two-component system chemotaxis response regulator CheY
MKPLSILLVDDSLLTIKKLRKMLEGLGHHIVGTASTGEQAIQEHHRLHPDLVTMDITMPDMDGIEATRRILEIDPEAVIIMVTSHGQEQMVMDAIDAGAKGYVLKPVKQDKLSEYLDSVVEKYVSPKL